MVRISTNNIKTGMRLARPALNAQGDVLLGEGAELNARHVSLFKMWGVSQVAVEEDDSESASGVSTDSSSHPSAADEGVPVEVQEEELRKRFEDVIEGSDVMQEIFRVVRNRLLESSNAPEE